MSWKIGMPNLGHTMEEGTVSQWLKRVGDTVSKGECIAVVETDKASFDIEAPADGTLIAILALAGAVVPVGDAIGLVGEAGETTETVPPPAVPAAHEQPSAAATTATATAATPPAVRVLRARISPVARALAEELGVDVDAIEGSGDDGMITRDDVRAHAAAASADKVQAPSPMRRAIAEATARSWQAIPHVPLQSHADVTELVGAQKVGLTAAITRACALALGEHGAFNGWLVEQGFRPSRTADIGLVISIPDGLVSAVVSAAETKSMAVLAQEIAQMAETARTGRLDGAKMTGASFSISSLGRWGVDAFAPIIPAPQVAILGVGRVVRVAREAPDGGVRFASELTLTLVFDHRANDGVAAAKLLAEIVSYLEQPVRMELNQ
ncbi:MAG: 2-oxo acid dehydrogenase subunit E2 [Betaproteobacteria bacterium]|nr:2-oxo acid dehydrogenase subunit E2 [Betaproteobacteria bacterium]